MFLNMWDSEDRDLENVAYMKDLRQAVRIWK